MSKVSRFEEVLVECLEALDTNATIEDCLSTYPRESDALRPFLELHARLLASEKPMAPASAYDAGRQALLARVASAPVARKRPLRELVASPLRGRGLRSPTLARAATAAALLVLLAGGALGASAAAGIGQARDALSVLPFVAPSGQGPGDGGVGIGSTPTSVLPGQNTAGTDVPRGTPHGPPTDVPRGTTPHGPPTDVPRGTTPHGPPTDVPRATPTPPGQSHRDTPHPPTATPPGQSHRQTPQGPTQTPPGQSHRQTPQGPTQTPPGQSHRRTPQGPTHTPPTPAHH